MTANSPLRSSSGNPTQRALDRAEGEGMIDRRESAAEESEVTWWRAHHTEQNYAGETTYCDFASAYRTGYRGYIRYGLEGCSFEEAELLLRRDYENGDFWLRWDEVRPAVFAAWARMSRRLYPLPLIS